MMVDVSFADLEGDLLSFAEGFEAVLALFFEGLEFFLEREVVGM